MIFCKIILFDEKNAIDNNHFIAKANKFLSHTFFFPFNQRCFYTAFVKYVLTLFMNYLITL